MRKGSLTHFVRGFFLLVLTLSEPSGACSIPVFRYALEFWPPDSYQLMVPRGDSTDMEEWLQGSSLVPMNMNLEAKADEGAGSASVVEIHAPGGAGAAPLWSGPMERADLERVVHSTARRQIVDRLFSGQAAVWVLLEGASPEWNGAIAALLESELDRLEGELTLPVDPATPDTVAEHPEFSALRVSRSDPAEDFLVRSLLASEEDLDSEEYAGSPMAFPIFGRGRILYALVGEGITPRNIEEACRFVVGPCSCQVKDLNPGFDLLLAADWNSAVKTMLEEVEASSASANGAPSPGQGVALRTLFLTLAILSGIVLIGAIFIFQRERAL